MGEEEGGEAFNEENLSFLRTEFSPPYILINKLKNIMTTQYHELDLACTTAVEYLKNHKSIDSIPEDEEKDFLISKLESKGGEFNGLGQLINWELYSDKKLIARRKPVKGGIVKRYSCIGHWKYNYMLEIEHTGAETISYKKI